MSEHLAAAKELGANLATDGSSPAHAAVQALLTLPLAPRSCEPDRFADVMLDAIALNGSFYNSHRMLEKYVSKAYTVGQEPR